MPGQVSGLAASPPSLSGSSDSEGGLRRRSSSPPRLRTPSLLSPFMDPGAPARCRKNGSIHGRIRQRRGWVGMATCSADAVQFQFTTSVLRFFSILDGRGIEQRKRHGSGGGEECSSRGGMTTAEEASLSSIGHTLMGRSALSPGHRRLIRTRPLSSAQIAVFVCLSSFRFCPAARSPDLCLCPIKFASVSLSVCRSVRLCVCPFLEAASTNSETIEIGMVSIGIGTKEKIVRRCLGVAHLGGDA